MINNRELPSALKENAESSLAGLLEQLAQLRLITDGMPALVSYVDKNRRYQFVNKMYTTWFGHTTENIRGKHLREVLGEEAYQATKADVDKVLTGEAVEFERRVPYKAGGTRYVRASYLPDKDADGTVKGYFALVQDISARKESEQRLLRLQTLTAHLAGALSTKEIIGLIVTEGLVSLGASGSTFALLSEQGDEFEIVESYGYSPETVEKWRRFPVKAGLPMADVLQAGQPLFFGTKESAAKVYPELLASAKGDHAAWVVLPLRGTRKTLGAVAISFAESQTFDTQERDFIQTLVGQCSQALERASLMESETLARRVAEVTVLQLASLQVVTSRLASALTPDDVVRVVLKEGLNTLGAKAGTVALLEGSQMRLLGAEGYAEEVVRQYTTFPLGADVPLAEATRTGRSLWLGSSSDFVNRYGRPPSVGDYQAWATVPLKVNDRTLGGLGLAYGEPQTFGETERSFIHTLADLCAQALERARLYQENFLVAKVPAENPNPVLRITPDGSILYANDAARPLLNFWKGQNVQTPPPEFQTLLADVFRTARKKTVDLDYDDRTLSCTLAPILEGGYVNVYGSDITERKKLERDLREADKRKDEFLAMLAHELRNPLAPIRLGVELLKRSDDPATQQEVRDMVERQTAQMVHLIDDLLDVSRISRGKITLKKERLALADVVTMAVESSRGLMEDREHRLEVSLPASSLLLYGDNTRLVQIVSNLLTNAAKYTHPGGTIRLSARPEGSEVVITVQDNGIGIPETMLGKVFEMFTRVERQESYQQQGLGIGLSLVKQLVELHGGSVEVSSAGEGKGSTFTVRLPALPPELKQETLPTATTLRTASRRVLLVDDYEPSLQTMSRMLGLMGHEVATAKNGAEALECLAVFKPEVILLDLNMPGMSGYEVAAQIKAQPQYQHVTLVALTGYGQEEDLKRTKEAGFQHHLVKPVEIEKLETVLASLP